MAGRLVRMAVSAAPVLLSIAASAVWGAGQGLPNGEWSLRLAGGLLKPMGTGDTARPCAVMVDLQRERDVWAPAVWAYAHEYNRAEHWGTARKTKRSESEISLHIDLDVKEDGWIGGGKASYDVTLRLADSRVQGDYSGEHNGRTVKGEVTGVLAPRRLAPVRPGDVGPHPRLVFRMADMPRLRERMKTPEGKEMLAICQKDWDSENGGFGYKVGMAGAYSEGSHAANHAFMFLVEGDASRIGRAKKLLETNMNTGFAQDEMWSGRVLPTAMVYDYVRDQLDEPFKQKVREYLRKWARYYTYRPDDLRPQAASVFMTDLNPYAPELAAARAAAGVAALVLLGEPADEPAKPQVVSVQVDKDFQPGKGVPVTAFGNDRCLTDWLALAGPLEDPTWRPDGNIAEADPLAGIGGWTKARPELGTKVEYRQSTSEFQPLARDRVFQDAYTDGRSSVNLLRDVHLQGQTVDCFYGVIENDRPRFMKVDLGDRYLWRARIRLGEQEVAENQVVHLPAGRFPLLIVARIPTKQTYAPYYPAFYGRAFKNGAAQRGRRGYWHYNYVCLDADPVNRDPKADIWMTPRLLEAEDPLETWKRARAEWEEAKGRDVEMARIATIAARSVKRFLETVISKRGWYAENESYGSVFLQVGYFLHAYQTATGREVAAATGIEHLLRTVELRGESCGGSGTAEINKGLAVLAGLTAPEDRPVARWMLDRRVKKFPAPDPVRYGLLSPQDLPFALLNYPFDVPAQDPNTAMPKTWHDEEASAVVLRAENLSELGIGLVVHTARQVKRNVGISSSFSVVGLGQRWNEPFKTLEACPVPLIGQFNTVYVEGCLPADTARILAVDAQPDGSGQVRLDTSPLYLGAKFEFLRHDFKESIETVGKVPSGLWPSVVWGDGGPYDAKVRGLRCVAADYSGKSGAPAMFVVVDRFTGAAGKQKSWQMSVPSVFHGATYTKRTTMISTGANTLTVAIPKNTGTRDKPALQALTDEDARMQVTFIGVAEAKPEVFDRGRLLYRSRVSVPAADGVDGFFVVITLQRGAPPAVKVEGTGLAAKVTIGKRTIRFNGEKVLIE